MTLTRAIEIVEKRRQCEERIRDTRCDFTDNDNCCECVMYVTGKRYEEAVDTLYRFAKGIKKRCNTKD